MDQQILDWLPLRVDNHRLHRRLVAQVDIENRVMAGLGEEDLRNVLGVDLDRHCIMARSIQHAGNLARGAYTARGILVELTGTGFGSYDFRHVLSFLVSGTESSF